MHPTYLIILGKGTFLKHCFISIISAPPASGINQPSWGMYLIAHDKRPVSPLPAKWWVCGWCPLEMLWPMGQKPHMDEMVQ